MLAIQPATGAIIVNLMLPSGRNARDAVDNDSGHYLALSADGRMLAALVPGTSDTPTTVTILDTATGARRRQLSLAGSDVYRSIVIGPRSGRIYLVGNRPEASNAATASPASPPEDVLLAVLDPTDGKILFNGVLKQAAGRDWRVYQALLTSDENQLLISYHGVDTTGIDWFDKSREGWRRCQTSPNGSSGCLESHGGMQIYDGGVLAATGGPMILVAGHDGRVERSVNTYLDQNHLMEFAADPRSKRLYAVGPCDYAGSFSIVGLAAGKEILHLARFPLTGPPRNSLLCGERIALWRESTVVIGQPNGILLLNSSTGAEMHVVTTATKAIDVIVVG